MEFFEVIKNRYSCRKFKEKAIEAEKLGLILDAGVKAPTAKNLQEQRIYCVESSEGLSTIDELTPCRYGAPVVLVVAYDKSNVFNYPGGKHNSGVEDATIVATHMILAAAALAVDSCIVNRFDPEETAEKLGLPKNEEIVMLIDLGYALEGTGPSPRHSERKDVSETVIYI